MNIELVRDWLSSEGYKYELNDDSTGLRFKYQGLMIYFEADKNDEQFFRLLMPDIYTLENNREKVLEVCNAISSEIKLIKAFLIEDHLFLSIEVFVVALLRLEISLNVVVTFLCMLTEKQRKRL